MRKASYAAIFCLLLLGCDIFNPPLKDYIRSATGRANGRDYAILTDHHVMADGSVAIPPADVSGQTVVNVFLNNKEKYNLDITLEGLGSEYASLTLGDDRRTALVTLVNQPRAVDSVYVFDLTLNITANTRPMPSIKLPRMECRYLDDILAALSVSSPVGIALSPPFASDTKTYTISLSRGVSAITLSGILPHFGTCLIQDTRKDWTSDSPGFTHIIPVEDSVECAIPITVTADSGKTNDYTLEIIWPVYLIDVYITAPPTKTQYNVGEELNTAGMVVTAAYSNGSTQAVTGYTVSGYDKTKTGNQTITVTWQGMTMTFTVNVINPTIPIAAAPTIIPAGGTLVAAGTEITLTTATDGAEIWYIIADDAAANGAIPAKGGAGSIKYTGPFAITPPVTVKAAAFKDGWNDSAVTEAVYPATPITAAGISITAPANGARPATEAFSLEQERFTSGTVTWEPAHDRFQGSTVYTATVTLTAKSGYIFTGIDHTQVKVSGEPATTVEVDNIVNTLTLSHTFTATKDKIISGIERKTPPINLNYTHGDNFDLEGMVVMLIYDDYTTEDVEAADFTSQGITTDPGNSVSLEHTTYNNKPIKISFGDFPVLDTYNLTVNAFNVSDLTLTPAPDLIPNQTYTGTPIVLEVSVTHVARDSVRLLQQEKDYTVEYADNTYVGQATATMTGMGDYTGSRVVTFDIIKADPSFSSWPTAAAITYGQTLADSKLTGGVSAIPGTFAWDDDPATVPALTNSGYSVRFTPEDMNNYNTVTHTVSVTVRAQWELQLAVGDIVDEAAGENFSPIIIARSGAGQIKTVSVTGDYYSILWEVDGVGIYAGQTVSSTERTFTLDGSNVRYNTLGGHVLRLTVTKVQGGKKYQVNIPFRVVARLFTDVGAFGTWLADQPANTAATAYVIGLNIGEGDFTNLRTTLNNNSTKYVFIDLSGSDITTIPSDAFSGSSPLGCTTLVGITIPNSVISIGGNAFNSCANLTSITIPSSVTSVYWSTFGGCTSLTAINVDAANTTYSSDNGVLYDKDKTLLIRYPLGKTDAIFTIPNSVISIGRNAFYGCTNLASLIIPNSVTSIEAYAFNTFSLTSVTFQGTIPSNGFNSSAFQQLGDLRAKFYATNATNGTPGTYMRESGGTVWTKVN